MKRILKWIGIVVAVVLGLVLVAFIGLAIYGQSSFKRTYADRPSPS